MIGGVGLVFIPLIIRFIPSMTTHIKQQTVKESPFNKLLVVCKEQAQRSALIFSCLLMMGHFLIIPFLNPYLEFNKGFSKDQTPVIYLVGGMASLIAAIFLGRMADKKGKLAVFSVSLFLSLFMVLIITKMPNVHFPVVLTFFAIWFMVATGRIVTAQAMISEVVKPEQRGSFMSINGSVQQLGSGLAALFAGLIVYTDKSGKIINYNWVGYLSIGVLLTSLVYGRMIFRKIDALDDEKETPIPESNELVQETA
jgi:predicted MFS family arabinose efflux permease